MLLGHTGAGGRHSHAGASAAARSRPSGSVGEWEAGPARARAGGDEVSLLWDENMLTYTTRPPSGGQRRF